MDFRPNIERGMAWLDEHRPGWEHRIDLSRLDLNSTCDCLLGQEFDLEAQQERQNLRADLWGWAIVSGYDFGFNMFGLANSGIRIETGKQVKHFGFATADDDDYPELTATWRKAIEERLDALNIPHDKLEQQEPKHALATAG